MRNDWIVSLLEEKASGRPIALKGVRGQDEEIENLICGKWEISCYYTSITGRVNGEDTFSFAELGKAAEKPFLIIPSVEGHNEKEWEKLRRWGYRELEDFLWINHYPIACAEIEGGSDWGGYGNQARVSSPGIKIHFAGICSEAEIGKNVKWPPNLQLTIGSDIHIKIGNNVALGNSKIKIARGGSLVIGGGCRLTKTNIFVNSFSELVIGKDTTMQDGRIRTGRNRRIVVGEDCMFSWATTLLAHDGHMIYDAASGKCLNDTAGERCDSIVIGDHVWVGGETAVLPNSRIGTGSICGYRSLIKGSIPEHCIAAGSPARVVRRDIVWSRSNVSEGDFGCPGDGGTADG